MNCYEPLLEGEVLLAIEGQSPAGDVALAGLALAANAMKRLIDFSLGLHSPVEDEADALRAATEVQSTHDVGVSCHQYFVAVIGISLI